MRSFTAFNIVDNQNQVVELPADQIFHILREKDGVANISWNYRLCFSESGLVERCAEEIDFNEKKTFYLSGNVLEKDEQHPRWFALKYAETIDEKVGFKLTNSSVLTVVHILALRLEPSTI
jgi:hypothetical protein